MITDEQIDAIYIKSGNYSVGDQERLHIFARLVAELALQVKPLEWVLQDRFHHAVRQNYKVSAEPTRIGYSVYYRGGLLGRAMSVTDAKQLAQADFDKRVLENLVHGGG